MNAPVPTATQETALREAASFLYLADIMDRFCALLSSSGEREKKYNCEGLRGVLALGKRVHLVLHQVYVHVR